MKKEETICEKQNELRKLFKIISQGEQGSIKLEEIEKILQEHQSQINDKDEYGNTLLHYAAFRGEIEIVRLLKKCGANFKVINENGWTSLHSAAYGIVNEKEDWETFRYLLENGVDYSVKAVGGITIEDILADEGFRLIEEYRRILDDIDQQRREKRVEFNGKI